MQRDYWPTEGWRETAPEEQGMDADILAGLDPYIDTTPPDLNAILIIRHGAIVFERYPFKPYYQAFDRNGYQLFHSITKSVISLLIGIALQQGYIQSLDQHWQEFTPEYFVHTSDLRKRQINIRHLLKMTSGLNPDYLGYPGYERFKSDDWVRFALKHPIRAEPGQFFMYSSLGSHLLSVFLTEAIGMSTLEFARRFLFGPLGIASDEQKGFMWETDPRGYYLGGTGLRLRPRDAAKLGYLALNNGLWDGQQLLPIDYIQAATSEQSEGGYPEASGYGYLWWTEEQLGYHSFYAAGFGGQYIQVFPELDTMILMFAPDEPATGVYHRHFIPSLFVIPSILDK
jgi:CubicO group peptidase (beta-lactamase class C family)